MSDWVFEFYFHIDRLKRPENFPRVAVIREEYQNIESDRQLMELYNLRTRSLAASPGVSFFPEGEMQGPSPRFDQRLYIPWHMITYMHGSVKPLTLEPKLPDLAIPSIEPSNPTEKEKKPKVH